MSKPTEQENDKRPTKGRHDWLSENLEAILIAVIMALVIRHFCIEAFKIPTSSMEPTLIGMEVGGDRILVNKFAYEFQSPDRWDVIVFKYPLNKEKNFIKRLIGLPGEEIKIAGGDLYIRGPDRRFHLSRKPESVQTEVWQEVYPIEDGEWSQKKAKISEGRWEPITGTALTFDERIRGGTLRPAGGSTHGEMYFTRAPIHVHGQNIKTGDVKLSFEAQAGEGVRAVTGLIYFGEDKLEFSLAVEGRGEKTCIVRNGKTVHQSDEALPPGEWTRVEFLQADAQARLRLDGDTLIVHPFERSGAPSGVEEFAVQIRVGVLGGTVSVRDLRVHRDLYYLRDGILSGDGLAPSSVIVPEGHYFVLGDNTASSKDSRLWEKLVLKRRNGTVVEGDAQPPANAKPNEKIVRSGGEIFLTDIDGRRVHLVEDELESLTGTCVPAPFVPEKYLIGQAFLVFWPMKRLKLIR